MAATTASPALKQRWDRVVAERIRSFKIDWDGLTFGRFCALVIGFCFFYQPFVDQAALLDWFRSCFSSQKMMVVLGSFLVNNGLFWLSNGFIAVLYWLQIPYIEQFKIDKTKQWPWLSSNPQERSDFKKLAWRNALFVLGCQVCFTLPTTFIGYNPRMDFRSETIPPWYESMLKVFVAMNIYFVGFYWSHRLLHVKWLYGRFHKMHHAMKPSLGIVANLNHPFDNFITNHVPFGISLMCTNMHGYTYFMWMAILVLLGVDDHTGYSFPCSPFRLFPDASDADYHYWHHISTGNFGSPLVDDLFGTNKEYKEWREKMMQGGVMKTEDLIVALEEREDVSSEKDKAA